MKKVLYSLVLFISLFAFANVSYAANFCYYEYNGSDGELSFSLNLSNGNVVSLNRFEGHYDGTIHRVDNADSDNVHAIKEPWEITGDYSTDTCPDKIYYNQKKGVDSVSVNKTTGTIEGHEYTLTHVANRCENANYPCAVCNYSTTYYDVIYIASYQDNKQKLEVINTGANRKYNQQYPSFVNEMLFANFIDNDSNTLTCPSNVYSIKGTVTLNSKDKDKKTTYMNPLNSYENGKILNANIHSCEYGDIILEFNMDAETITIHNFDSSIRYGVSMDSNISYLDYNGSCPNYEITCTQGYTCRIEPYDGTGRPTEGTPTISYGNITKYLGAIINPIKAINPNILDYKIKVNNVEKKLGSLTANDNICGGIDKDCSSNPYNYLNKGLYEAKSYCNVIFKSVADNKTTLEDTKVKDCIAFDSFYNNLVKDKVIDDLSKDCGLISTDLNEKLQFILNLIKIIGPLAAIFLGMLDFVKAVMSGDPDKETKTAFKRLTTRLIAAALLFIIPLILGFLMDLFLSNDKNYDQDNPFCDLVDWSE